MGTKYFFNFPVCKIYLQDTQSTQGAWARRTCRTPMAHGHIQHTIQETPCVFIFFVCCISSNNRSSHQKCSLNYVLLEIFQNSEKKLATFIKKETRAQVLSCEFCEIFQNNFLVERFGTPALLTKSTGFCVAFGYRSKTRNQSYYSTILRRYFSMVMIKRSTLQLYRTLIFIAQQRMAASNYLKADSWVG